MSEFRDVMTSTVLLADASAMCGLALPAEVTDAVLAMPEMQFIHRIVRAKATLQPSNHLVEIDMLIEAGWPEAVARWAHIDRLDQ